MDESDRFRFARSCRLYCMENYFVRDSVMKFECEIGIVAKTTVGLRKCFELTFILYDTVRIKNKVSVNEILN